MGQFLTGITVITTHDEAGQPVGLTVNSFNSVSLSPPLVLWSLTKKSKRMHTFMQSTHFGVSILSAEQEHLSRHFASHSENHFQDLDVFFEQPGIALIPGAIAHFVCRIRSRYDEGDHVILVGEVEKCQAHKGQALAYRARQYFQI